MPTLGTSEAGLASSSDPASDLLAKVNQVPNGVVGTHSVLGVEGRRTQTRSSPLSLQLAERKLCGRGRRSHCATMTPPALQQANHRYALAVKAPTTRTSQPRPSGTPPGASAQTVKTAMVLCPEGGCPHL